MNGGLNGGRKANASPSTFFIPLTFPRAQRKEGRGSGVFRLRWSPLPPISQQNPASSPKFKEVFFSRERLIGKVESTRNNHPLFFRVFSLLHFLAFVILKMFFLKLHFLHYLHSKPPSYPQHTATSATRRNHTEYDTEISVYDSARIVLLVLSLCILEVFLDCFVLLCFA